MSDTQPDPSWWLAVDGRWYPPELHPDAANTPTGGPTFRGSAGSGPTQIRDRAERGRIGEEAGTVLARCRQGRLRDDVARVTQDLAHAMEHLIRLAPEQWHLMQPNWPSDLERKDA